MKYGFFIVCRMKNDSHSRFANVGNMANEPAIETLKWNLKGLREFHPDAPVFIIDSNSPDQNYHEKVEEQFNVKVDYAKNNNYTVGAIKHVFENYKDFDYYFFLQDSQRVDSNLEDCLKYDLSTYSYFNSHKGVHRSRMGREFGFDRQENIDLGDKLLKKHTELDGIPDVFTGCWGSIMYCKRHVLESLDEAGYFNMLPEDKHGDHMMERLTGIMLEHLGFNLKENSLRGSRRVLKKFRARK